MIVCVEVVLNAVLCQIMSFLVDTGLMRKVKTDWLLLTRVSWGECSSCIYCTFYLVFYSRTKE